MNKDYEFDTSLLSQALTDLGDDFEELLYLVDSYLENLHNFEKELRKTKKYISIYSYKVISNQLLSIYKLLKGYKEELVNIKSEISNELLLFERSEAESRTTHLLLDSHVPRRVHGRSKNKGVIVRAKLSGVENYNDVTQPLQHYIDNHSKDYIQYFRQQKNKYQDLLRTTVNLIGGLITSSDWQSPSYSHSLISNAGRQTGKISGTINDYKRDVHLDEESFEKQFLKEYMDGKFKFNLKALLTNSGQAAFTTILTYLQSENKIKGKILLGSSSYFQYKQILAKTFNNQIILVDEEDTNQIIQSIKKYQPSVIFFDSLCNAKNIPVPNLVEVISYLYRNCNWESYLVIDNTCLSVKFQPFRYKKSNRNVHLITFESLNKYYQFGLDRVTTGIIVAEKLDAVGLFEYRKHAGTNISDASVHTLPSPNRKLLHKRLARHWRNAKVIADYLNNKIQNTENDKIRKIIYPNCGSFFNIEFKDQWQKPRKIKYFIDLVVNLAKKHQVNMVAGTSFGLNTTRVYLTSLWSKYGQPFLRVSVGTEDLMEVEKLKAVFGEAVNKFPGFSLSLF